jgi:hypothetical protein
MTIETQLGCKSEAMAWAFTGTKQKASFSSDLSGTICANQKVQFYNLSQEADLINYSYWVFSDGTKTVGTMNLWLAFKIPVTLT